MADRLDADLATHARRAARIIADRLKDARNHALLGEIAEATQRLVELHHSLIGPAGEGAIGDARSAFYRRAFDEFDPRVHDPAEIVPTPEGIEAARTIPLFDDVDAHCDLGIRVAQARISLSGAVALRNPDLRATAIRTWHAQHAATLHLWAVRTLTDSQMLIHWAVERMRLRPEFRAGL